MENPENNTELNSYEDAFSDYEKQMQHGLVAYMIAQSEIREIPSFVKEIQNETRFSKKNLKDLKC